MKMNHHYGELKASYLFVDIAHKVAAYQEAHPEKEIIRLGIGDVTQPLAKCVVTAMQDAAAAAVFTESGMAEIQANLDDYRQNAKVIADALDECGVWYCGGKNSPYIWLRCPGGMKSWEFFDWLLENCGVVGTPGVGFGECGEGYFRLTAFGDAEKTKIAAQRIKAAIQTL